MSGATRRSILSSRPIGHGLTVGVGTVVTTEVPGLAGAFQRPAVAVEAEFHLPDGRILITATALPDVVSCEWDHGQGSPSTLAAVLSFMTRRRG